MNLQSKAIVDGMISKLCANPGRTADIRALRKGFSRQLAEADPKVVLAIANELIRRAPHGRFVAYELAHFHAPTMDRITLKDVESLGKGISDWAAVDTFACYVSGPAWAEGRISDAAIQRWARSDDRWLRRAALVSTVPLNARGRASAEAIQKTFDICKMLLRDRDDMVVKAMSWALRAACKRNAAAVKKFLRTHRDMLASRVIREVQNKLATGVKNPGVKKS